MKTIMYLIGLFLAVFTAYGQGSPTKTTLRQSPVPDSLINSLIKVESGGNDHALGDKHLANKAYGPLQIRAHCLRDVNRRAGTRFTLAQIQGNRPLSVWVCRTYLEMYATSKNIGRTPTLEDMARIWNGGPTGWKRKSTKGYGQRVLRLTKS